MVQRLLIMGPQGVGKGTQAALLSKHYGIPAISTGDIFRYNLKNGTELGIAKRLDIYAEKTAPLLDTYKSRGLLVAVDGQGEVDRISQTIIEELDRR